MAKLTLTIDENGPMHRAALWRGRELVDLFRSDRTSDLEGAIINARLVRVLKGEAAGFCNAALTQPVYIEKLSGQKTGSLLTLEITENPRHGKAYGAKLAKVQHMDLPLGIVTLPPEPWQRALSHAKQENIAAIMCSESKILKSCQEQLPMLAPLMTYDAVVRADLDQACDALAAPRISLKCGAELVIESTEALTAIDVNQATASHILTANLEAMKETARQIRLRDIRGIIVIDALKLTARTDQAKLLNILKTAVSTDWRKVHVFGMTKLGLIELTRSSA